MIFLKRQLPLIVTFCMGVVFAMQYYIPHPVSEALLTDASNWMIIIGGFALILGLVSLIQLHVHRIQRNAEGWGYSAVLFAAMGAMVIAGIWAGGENVDSERTLTGYGWAYSYAMVPLQGTMFSLLAFFVASAAYRAFRARTKEAALLLVAAILMMWGRVPLGEYLWAFSGDVAQWILNVINSSVRRAILIGISLGVVALAIKIIFGIERTYLGGGKE